MSGGSSYTWSILANGKATFNHLTANGGGQIGGWTIGSNYLKGGSLTLNNNGAINGSGWSISAAGLAHFTKVYGQVANGYTFVGGGITMSGGGSAGSSSINPGSVGYSGSSGIGSPGTLGNGLYSDHKARFDSIYATKAQFNELSANVANIGNAQITQADIENAVINALRTKNIDLFDADIHNKRNGAWYDLDQLLHVICQKVNILY